MKAADILPLFEQVRPLGTDRWQVKCPAHEDSRPSLSIKQVADKVLVYCHAGCTHRAISDAVGLREQDWFEDGGKPLEGITNRKLISSARLNQQRVYRDELDRIGRELRKRDIERIAINQSVADGKRTEDEAMELLAPIYLGYSAMEYRFMELLKWA